MLGALRAHLTYANFVSSLCLFLLLGGVAWAATLPSNSIGPSQIKTNAIGPSEVKKNAIGRSEIKKDGVSKSEIKDGGVGEAEVRDGSLTALEFAPGVQLQGPQGLKGDKGTTGASGATNVITRSNPSATGTTANSLEGATVGCQGSEQRVGGGAEIVNYEDSGAKATLEYSIPHPTNGWQAAYRPDTTDANAYVRTWVVCASP